MQQLCTLKNLFIGHKTFQALSTTNYFLYRPFTKKTPYKIKYTTASGAQTHSSQAMGVMAPRNHGGRPLYSFLKCCNPSGSCKQ